jgi:hypothetical protein
VSCLEAYDAQGCSLKMDLVDGDFDADHGLGLKSNALASTGAGGRTKGPCGGVGVCPSHIASVVQSNTSKYTNVSSRAGIP